MRYRDDNLLMEWFQSKSKAKIEGKYNFHLQLNTELIDSSTTLNIIAYTDKKQQAVVPCNYAWFIIKNGVPQEVPEFRGSSFICQTSSIGYHVQTHITSNDQQYSGKAIVTLGPVELDVTLKSEIYTTLSQGYNNLAVYLLGQDQQQRQCTIQVHDDKIRIMHAFSDLSYTFDYSLMEPLFTHHPKEINRITIVFNQKYEQELRRFQRRLFNKQEISFSRSSVRSMNQSRHDSSSNNSGQNPLKLDLKFVTRSNRDLFLFAIKAFITKREIKNSAVIRKIEKINFDQNEQFSAVHQVHELRRDLVRYDRAYKKLAGDKKRLEDRDKDYTAASLNHSRRDDPSLVSKVNQLQRENDNLNTRIRSLVQQISQIKTTTANSNPLPPAVSFKKKNNYEQNTISHLLDDLNRSEQMVHFDAQNQVMIDRLKIDKQTLEASLKQANEKVTALEKRGTQIRPGMVNVEKIMFDRMVAENQELKRSKDKIEIELRQARDAATQLKTQSQRGSRVQFNDGTKQRQIQDLRSKLFISQQQLQDQSKTKEHYEQKCLNLSRRVNDLEQELNMVRKNQDVLNRSQNLSMQMEDYNQKQIEMLKQQNEALLMENEALMKRSEKFFNQAKEAMKLKKEVMQLKKKLSLAALANPESNSFTQ